MINRMKKFLAALCFLFSATTYAQVGVGTSTPESSAQLDVSSTSKGLLVPRMTAAQRAAIQSPATGLMVYQTDGTSGFYYNQGTPSSANWVALQSTSTATGVDLLARNPTGQPGIAPNASLSIAYSSAAVNPAIGSFNTGTYTYTVGVTGNYMINVVNYFSGAGALPGLRLLIDGVATDFGVYGSATALGTQDGGIVARSTINVVKQLSAGQTVSISVVNANAGNVMNILANGTFSIIKL
jgi:hypothetical protein